MSKKQTLKSPGRRAFFKKAGVGVGAAGVVAVGLSSKSAKADCDSAKSRTVGSYRETEHVRKAYETARF